MALRIKLTRGCISNKDFDKKFDHGHTAPDDKVDKKFWQGGAGSKE